MEVKQIGLMKHLDLKNLIWEIYLNKCCWLSATVLQSRGGLMGAIKGGVSWLWIRVSSGFSETGNNKEDVQMIKDGIERWYKNYAK